MKNTQLVFITANHYRHTINTSKLESQLVWKVKELFGMGIVKTINWYLEKYDDQCY